VEPRRALADLGQEQPEGPRAGVDLLLDADDTAEVTPTQGHDVDLEVAWVVGRRRQRPGHQSGGPPAASPRVDPSTRPSRVIQLISASGRRRYSGSSSHGCTKSSRSARACASCTSDAADGWARPWSPSSTWPRSAK